MKLIRLLTENRANLYHGTSIDNLYDILSMNVLLSKTSHMVRQGKSFRPDDVDSFGYVEGVSLTRSKRFAQDWVSNEGAVLELDGNRLKQKHRIIPLDYYGNRREAEEFVVGSIRNLDQFLIAIHLSQDTLEWLKEQDEIFPDGGYDEIINHPKLKV